MTGGHFDVTAREQIRFIQDRLLAMARWAKEAGVDDRAAEFLIRPYRSLLDTMYQRELPLARLADQSDLLLHVRGPAATGPTPRVSMVTRLLSGTRDQITRLAKQLHGVTSLRVPAALDLGFVGVAEGSLYLGFSAEEVDGASATRDAVATIATASEVVTADQTLDDLTQRFEDPATRDIALAAVRQMSPSGHAGITEVDIYGRNIQRRIALTTQTRRHARLLMAQPPRRRGTPASTTFTGTVREVDLDASRFEIRNVDGHADDIRCAHELDEEDAKQLVDRRVRVTGRPEFGPKGNVRLLWVDELEMTG